MRKYLENAQIILSLSVNHLIYVKEMDLGYITQGNAHVWLDMKLMKLRKLVKHVQLVDSR